MRHLRDTSATTETQQIIVHALAKFMNIFPEAGVGWCGVVPVFGVV